MNKPEILNKLEHDTTLTQMKASLY